MSGTRRLAVNADDFGFTRDVNDGIVRCYQEGILTATTLMANGAAFDHAVELAAENPRLDVGVHLVLTGGRSVCEPGHELPASISGLLRRFPCFDWITREFTAQVVRVCASGIRPTHLDTHKHTHLLPPVLKAALAVAREFSIPWIRRPFDLPVGGCPPSLKRSLISTVIRPLQIPFAESLRRYGRRSTDYFAGFQMTGDFHTDQLLTLLESLPPGCGELMCHPGVCGEQLRSAPTRLKESREAELRALTSPEVARRAKDLGVEFVRFVDLS